MNDSVFCGLAVRSANGRAELLITVIEPGAPGRQLHAPLDKTQLDSLVAGLIAARRKLYGDPTSEEIVAASERSVRSRHDYDDA